MYKSPIDLIYDHVVTEQENEVFKAVVRCGIDVDKDELIKALAYDRRQYDVGYADGKIDAEPKWIPCSERLPEYFESVLTWDGHCYSVEKRIPYIRDEDGEPIKSEWWVSDDYDEDETDYYPNLRDGAAIAWKPLPEPYEVKE